MKAFFESEPVIFANKGGIREMPGNTEPAFKRAVELGADVIVTSVRITSDKKVIVVYEEKLDDISEISGRVSDYQLTELQGLDAGYIFTLNDGEDYPWRGKALRFMTLEELLEKFPEQKFFIELLDKDRALSREYCDIIKRSGAVIRVLTGAVDGKSLKYIRTTLPDVATTFSTMGTVGFYALFRFGILNFFKNFKADALHIPEAIGPSYMASHGLVSGAKNRGLKVYVWNANDEKDISRLKKAGVDGYITDDIVGFKELTENGEL